MHTTRGQSRTWAIFYPIIHSFKFLVCLLGSGSPLYTPDVNPGIHKQMYGVIFSSIFHVMISAVLSRNSSFLCSVLKAGCLVILVYSTLPSPCPYLGPSSKRIEGEKKRATKFCPIVWNHSFTNHRGSFPFLKIFTSPGSILTTRLQVAFIVFFPSNFFSIINIQYFNNDI